MRGRIAVWQGARWRAGARRVRQHRSRQLARPHRLLVLSLRSPAHGAAATGALAGPPEGAGAAAEGREVGAGAPGAALTAGVRQRRETGGAQAAGGRAAAAAGTCARQRQTSTWWAHGRACRWTPPFGVLRGRPSPSSACERPACVFGGCALQALARPTHHAVPCGQAFGVPQGLRARPMLPPRTPLRLDRRRLFLRSCRRLRVVVACERGQTACARQTTTCAASITRPGWTLRSPASCRRRERRSGALRSLQPHPLGALQMGRTTAQMP